MRWLKLLFPWFYVRELEKELEIERLRLAGCGVVAMQNTREFMKERIHQGHLYWSASYGDVCRAVDAEILYRELLERECQDIDNVIKKIGWDPADFRTEGGCLNVPKLLDALGSVMAPGSGG